MKKAVRKLRLCKESIRRLSGSDLGEARGAGATANPTCVGNTCLFSCATCPPTCETCVGTACEP